MKIEIFKEEKEKRNRKAEMRNGNFLLWNTSIL